MPKILKMCIFLIFLLFQVGIFSEASTISEALFLTPYIERGNIEEGQRAAYVDAEKWNISGIVSYSGFLNVDKSHDSNLFFWYFKSEISSENAPVLVWLQGGPGVTSLLGLFEENGAFYFAKNGTIMLRQFRWSYKMHVLYIDSPVGAGYSFTKSNDGYVKDQEQIGRHLLSAIKQFFQLFPELKKNKLFIAGESYAGKYIPSMAYAIHTSNKEGHTNINLQGIAIGNGLIDPITMLNYADYFYQLGLIDLNIKQEIYSWKNRMIHLIENKEFEDASNYYDNFTIGFLFPYPTYVTNKTGFESNYNLLHIKDQNIFGDLTKNVQTNIIRNGIHVGNTMFIETSKRAFMKLFKDLMKSVKEWFREILENYKVLLYSGQLDLNIPYTLTLDFLDSLDWSGAQSFRSAERKMWWVGDNLAGYSKQTKNLTLVLVRNSGHMVALDQPEWAFELINKFVNDESL